jgi:hypothetical protein
MENLDSLTVTSRTFYERAKLKVAASMFFGAMCLMLLGFASSSGGESNSFNLLKDRDGLRKIIPSLINEIVAYC